MGPKATAMKVFNLTCEHDHRFEGWFGSSDDYDSQLERGLLSCPMCDSHSVRKLPAAPRLNLSTPASSRGRAASAPAQRSSGRDAGKQQAALADPAQMQALLTKMARYIVENSEDVGERFADEARRIHENQAPERSIRGVASREQIGELLDDGIEVFSFPLPRSLKEPLQ
jgi:hypothetical protein